MDMPVYRKSGFGVCRLRKIHHRAHEIRSSAIEQKGKQTPGREETCDKNRTARNVVTTLGVGRVHVTRPVSHLRCREHRWDRETCKTRATGTHLAIRVATGTLMRRTQ